VTQAYPMALATGSGVDIDVLLAPVANHENAGAGVSLRYDPVYQQIRDARRNDDATLPMGDWERPLVKADWKRVATLCSEALATRSKDFQLAAWLCEAWTHQRGIEGLIAGTQLMTALAQHYWQHAWPEIEAGDTDARVAPFVWLNDAISLVLTLHLPLLVIEDREPEYVNLDEWQHVISGGASEDGAALTRDLLDKHVKKAGNLDALMSMHPHLATARAEWNALNTQLDELLGYDAPHLGRVADTLARIAQAVTSLLGAHAPAAAPAHDTRAVPHAVHGISQENAMNAALQERAAPPLSIAPVSAMPLSRVESRAHAYQLLELVAAYLAEHEPHSPTPYLLWRAVTWGNMPLPELMREVVRSEGDLARYLALLGIE
jgi:type VI secretion system protein ImpA